jgi:L-fuculose-phosphate aldolase
MSLRYDLSSQIIETCIEMNSSGLNQGTSGNVSVRYQDGMLITPTGVPYHKLTPPQIVFVDGTGNAPETDKKPSSEWRFHLDVLKARPDLHAVVHTHAINCTALSILNRPIPPLHYMIVASGSSHIPCVPYATYGTEELSRYVVEGMRQSKAILMQHHGMLAAEIRLDKALWLAHEVEVLAELYLKLLPFGEVPILSEEEIKKVMVKFANYGLK